MNIERTQEAIRVMQAWVDGELIQARGTLPGAEGWSDMDCYGAPWSAEFGPPTWNWGTCEYRIKPEPRVLYVNEYDDNLSNTHHMSESAAHLNATSNRVHRVLKFVEVLP